MMNNIKIASWNVNSLKVRLEQVLSFLKTDDVDILALQETKLTNENFPHDIFTDSGYYVSYSGQKTYNGVAIISKKPINNTITDVDGFNDPERRILAASIDDLRIINLYVPNGQSIESEKYQYKLNWLKNITNFIQQQLHIYPNLAVVGDFNIAPEDIDVHDIKDWDGHVLVSDFERQALKKITNLSLHDSFRNFQQSDSQFSWWDYRAASFRRNRGLRIDLILLSESLIKRCTSSTIIKEIRKHPRPSDHAPVMVTID